MKQSISKTLLVNPSWTKEDIVAELCGWGVYTGPAYDSKAEFIQEAFEDVSIEAGTDGVKRKISITIEDVPKSKPKAKAKAKAKRGK